MNGTRSEQGASGPPPVFISYSTSDYDVAKTIRDDLESDGIVCWFGARDILGSTDYVKEIPGAIENARVLILVLSAASMASDHVYREAHLALDFKRPILPVRLDSTPVEGRFKYLLTGVQWIDTGGLVGPKLEQIRSETRRLMGPDAPRPHRRSRFVENLVSAASWAGVLVLVGLVALLLHGHFYNLMPVWRVPIMALGQPLHALALVAAPAAALTLQYFSHRDLRHLFRLDALFGLNGRSALIRTAGAVAAGIILVVAATRIPPTLTAEAIDPPKGEDLPGYVLAHRCDNGGYIELKTAYAVHARIGANNPADGEYVFKIDVIPSDSTDGLELCAIWLDPRSTLLGAPQKDDSSGKRSIQIGTREGQAGSRHVVLSLMHSRNARPEKDGRLEAAVSLKPYGPVPASHPIALHGGS